MSKPKILILGYARHGKDTVCELLEASHGFRFVSSSYFCAAKVVYPVLKSLYRYETIHACFNDRSNHRAEWYDAIKAFNTPDPTALGRAIFENYDIYCGIRHHTEFQALRNAKVFDLSIWVDASDRVPPEDRSSCTVLPWMADFVLDNNRDLSALAMNLNSLYANRIKPLER